MRVEMQISFCSRLRKLKPFRWRLLFFRPPNALQGLKSDGPAKPIIAFANPGPYCFHGCSESLSIVS